MPVAGLLWPTVDDGDDGDDSDVDDVDDDDDEEEYKDDDEERKGMLTMAVHRLFDLGRSLRLFDSSLCLRLGLM